MTEANRNLLERFLEHKSEKPKIIVIYGPTACGKTALSLDIAEHLRSEIVSVDARQIYRWLDIGTGKIQPSEMRWIPHHMLDVLDVREAFSVVDFKSMSFPILTRIQSEWKIPILCGGTGLYIDSLIFERSYSEGEIDWSLRNELEDFRQKNGNEALWQKLYEIDKSYAETLHVNNYRYVIRGIEVFTKTGKSKWAIQDTPEPIFDTLFLTPYDGNREALYTKINARVEEMFDSWLVEEVEYIVRSLFWGDIQKTFACPGLATIGYKEVIDFLTGKYTLEKTIELVQQHNRNYAKRQITWNKKYGDFCLETRWQTS